MMSVIDERDFQSRLQRLERAWQRLDAPILRIMRPGLSESRIDELIAPTGLTLPDELRWWWQWHDGAVTALPDPDQAREIDPGGWLFLPLSEAVELYKHHEEVRRKYIAMGAAELAEITWRPELFPFSHRVWRPNDVLAADTSVPAHASAPVVTRAFEGLGGAPEVDSVAETVSVWVELLESGRYHIEQGSLQPVDPTYTEEPRLLWVL